MAVTELQAHTHIHSSLNYLPKSTHGKERLICDLSVSNLTTFSTQ